MKGLCIADAHSTTRSLRRAPRGGEGMGTMVNPSRSGAKLGGRGITTRRRVFTASNPPAGHALFEVLEVALHLPLLHDLDGEFEHEAIVGVVGRVRSIVHRSDLHSAHDLRVGDVHRDLAVDGLRAIDADVAERM